MPSMLVLKSARVAAHWNNEATLLIQQREYSKAAGTLTKALITFKEGLSTTTTTTTSSVSTTSPSSYRIAPTSTTSSITSSSAASSSFSSSEPVEEENDVMMEMETSSSSSLSGTTCLLKFLSIGKPEQDPQALLDNGSSSSSSWNTTTTASSSLQQQWMMAVPLEDDDMYLYHAPVQVTSVKALALSPLCVEILSYAIIYNLGLCHHLAAFLVQEEGTSASLSSRTMQLQRAISFYQHAQRLARAHALTFCYMDILHMLVLVNNMGHAHYSLDKESTMAKHCFKQLWHAILDYPTLLWMSTSTSTTTTTTQEDEHEHEHEHEQLLHSSRLSNHPSRQPSGLVQIFLLNVVHFLILGVGTRIAAPAA